MKPGAIGVGTIVATLAACALLLSLSRTPQPMPRADFIRIVHALQSIAHETGLFAEQVGDDRLPAPFARGHRDNLAELLADEREKLEDTLPRELAPAGARARDLCAELDASLAELQRSLADRDAVARIRGDVRRIEEALSRLEASP
jgi:hypothetical protein